MSIHYYNNCNAKGVDFTYEENDRMISVDEMAKLSKMRIYICKKDFYEQNQNDLDRLIKEADTADHRCMFKFHQIRGKEYFTPEGIVDADCPPKKTDIVIFFDVFEKDTGAIYQWLVYNNELNTEKNPIVKMEPQDIFALRYACLVAWGPGSSTYDEVDTDICMKFLPPVMTKDELTLHFVDYRFEIGSAIDTLERLLDEVNFEDEVVLIRSVGNTK